MSGITRACDWRDANRTSMSNRLTGDPETYPLARPEKALTAFAIGIVPAPAALLVRPDGYVANAGDHTQQGLGAALTTWFGPPAGA